ncbi:riboflavin synthase [Oculatella sp. LEGE 06141]|uniref:riboflavin synthase n=1 Tax=Oculatella sp. LEGE 06141 TaxID=1828648 RepID=UPI00187FD47D|nr:riboflavin synthase [Oculatella sp. LEGE 06141]
MFTGLIQALGTIHPLGEDQLQIACSDPKILQDLAIGDSVAVDGICLTVTTILSNGFTAAVSPETLDRTSLGYMEGNAHINLEPSLRVGSKLGGHFVTGHIDGIGYLEESVSTANAWEMSFTVPDARVSRYIVPKGSIAINGISLTVADCNATGTWFKVAVIPLTYAETNLRFLQPGGRVNLEGDVLGKYVEKFLRLGSNSTESVVSELEDMIASNGSDSITPSFLTEHGYL